MGSRTRRRQREQGVRKNPTESKDSAELRGIERGSNQGRPWRKPLRRILGRKKTELRRAGYKL